MSIKELEDKIATLEDKVGRLEGSINNLRKIINDLPALNSPQGGVPEPTQKPLKIYNAKK